MAHEHLAVLELTGSLFDRLSDSLEIRETNVISANLKQAFSGKDENHGVPGTVPGKRFDRNSGSTVDRSRFDLLGNRVELGGSSAGTQDEADRCTRVRDTELSAHHDDLGAACSRPGAFLLGRPRRHPGRDVNVVTRRPELVFRHDAFCAGARRISSYSLVGNKPGWSIEVGIDVYAVHPSGEWTRRLARRWGWREMSRLRRG